MRSGASVGLTDQPGPTRTDAFTLCSSRRIRYATYQNCTKIRLGPFQVHLNCWSAAHDEQKNENFVFERLECGSVRRVPSTLEKRSGIGLFDLVSVFRGF